MLDWALLGGAAALAGALNSVAGGGSFLTLPALALMGVPLVSANATGTAALLPGYLAGTWALRRELSEPMSPSLVRLGVLSVLGGAAGAALLLSTSNQVFGRIVPWLLLAATQLFVIGPKLVRRRADTAKQRRLWIADLGIVAVAIYGGYFNGGLGILLLAVLGTLGQTDMGRMNGIKNFVSAILTLIAVAIYAASGAIVWTHALWMAVGATLGGYVGGTAARRLKPGMVRGFVVLTGLAMTGAFFLNAR
ncbi:sulfite exporter TauE/SafE family protein [Cupriavidus basilensis]|uniref:Probable membrane transporter protein n=1 Tax=Cupriavidus basilensis TaxID=68895 RepID=A0ABT6AZ17_9BURK|nr:sulfite exporter TauE/SafE family protein [Cupriavidus basilensis]MDF3837856.1 sulfite exporter TauE/SafE family protein [Cupriavidus basilensis]